VEDLRSGIGQCLGRQTGRLLAQAAKLPDDERLVGGEFARGSLHEAGKRCHGGPGARDPALRDGFFPESAIQDLLKIRLSWIVKFIDVSVHRMYIPSDAP
jgi:hypothetical protein